MKTYVITLSRNFLAGHPKAGEPTNFRDKFINKQKVHTIRGNYELWSKRIQDVQEGKAVLSIREWSGVPYRSLQTEIARLDAGSGVGIQRLEYNKGVWFLETTEGTVWFRGTKGLRNLAKNDGLELEDWIEWFKKSDFTKPFAIIHFGPGRY